MLKLKHQNLIFYALFGVILAVFIGTLPKKEDTQLDIKGISSKVSENQAAIKAKEVAYQQVLNWHIFGTSTSSPIKLFIDFKIKLVGIIHKDKANPLNQAILSIHDREVLYLAGQKIPGVGEIKTVEKNRVLINTQDGLKALELFK